MVDELHILEQEYCPPLDPALVHAIHLDFAGQEGGLQAARELLDGLRQAAVAEQLTEFDPSGSSGAPRSSPSKLGSDDVESSAGTGTETSQTTLSEDTGLSIDLAALSLGKTSPASEGSLQDEYFRDTEAFDTQTKEVLLAESFPTLRKELVAYTLKKCDGDFAKATDELLNHVYFEDETDQGLFVGINKGVEGFSEEHHVPLRGKKGKKRKQKGSNLYDATPTEPDLSVLPQTNKWKDGNRDIEFMVSRTHLPAGTVASLYHANGASLASTIAALLRKDMAANKKDDPTALYQLALELTDDFPSIPLDYAIALIRLTHPSTANAHELAKALSFVPSSLAQRPQGIIPHYAPVNLAAESNAPEPISRLPSLAPAAVPHTTTSLANICSTSFEKASVAHRKGKSNPLYRSVAGYYAQVGRDASSHLHAQSLLNAEALVSSQSTATQLDLHGVSVEAAVGIAKKKTREWWEGLGEERVRGYRGQGGKVTGEGFRIVVGRGVHSEKGRGKLGPAVGRALMGEGWRVEVGRGEVVVWGLARR